MKMIQSRSKKFMSILATLFMISFGIMASGCGGGGGGGGGGGVTEAPGAPENVAIDGTRGKGMLTLTLTWDAPTTGGAVASYEIYRSDLAIGVFDPANHYVSLPATIDPLQFIENAGMEDNTSYWVVSAKNVVGETPALPAVSYEQGSSGGEGEIEGYGNNFSAALIFADGYGITGLPLDPDKEWSKDTNPDLIDYNTGLRPLSSQVVPDGILPYLDENTTHIIGGVTYYKQQTVSTWQGQWVDGSALPQNVLAKWSDNMVSQTQLTTNSVFRIEMGLTKALNTPMTSYNMELLYGSGMNEMQGTDGTEYNNTTAIVYASTARLKVQKVVTLEPLELQELPTPVNQPLFSCEGGLGCFGAEVTVSGNLTYGFVWKIPDNNRGAGTYRITFLLDETADNATGATNNTNIETCPNGTQVDNTCYIDVNIAAFGE